MSFTGGYYFILLCAQIYFKVTFTHQGILIVNLSFLCLPLILLLFVLTWIFIRFSHFYLVRIEFFTTFPYHSIFFYPGYHHHHHSIYTYILHRTEKFVFCGLSCPRLE